jgi:ABC-type lipoprotein export system ATPase subunit
MVLEFQQVTVKGDYPYDVGLEDASLALMAGELALVLVAEGLTCTPLADAAQGLVVPAGGSVRLLGQAWDGVKPDEANSLRARTGRVFERYGWISNLDVDENIALEQRNHSKRTDDEIMAEAADIAKSFRIELIPHVRPAVLPRQELRRAEWVRALVGKPELILLERPTREMGVEWTEILARRLDQSRREGAAVLWLTDELEEWTSPHINPTLKLRMQGSKMVPIENSNLKTQNANHGGVPYEKPH